MIATFKALRALSPEQKKILEAQKVSGKHTPRWLLDTLRALAEFDALSDKSRTRIGVQIGICVVALVASVIMAANGLTFMLLVALLAIGLAIYLAINLRRLSKLDLSNNFRIVAMPFFAVLNQDMAPGAELDLELDLSSPTAKNKKGKTSVPYKKGAYHKVVDTYYADPWFRGSAKLADGSVLTWDVADDITTSSRTKRTSRGKLKMKSAARKVTHLTVGVALPTDTYAIGTGPIADGDKFKFVEGEKRNTIKLGRKIKAKSLEPMTARDLIDIVGEAYLRAKPAGTGGASNAV
jgi:hypothetical protein